MMLDLSEAYPQIVVAIAIVAAAIALTSFILKNIKKNKQASSEKNPKTNNNDKSSEASNQVELLRQVANLVKFFTNDNGEPKKVTSCVVDEKMFHHHEKRFDTIEKELGTQGMQLNKLDADIRKLDEGQELILEHITRTNGDSDKQEDIERKIAIVKMKQEIQ